MLRQRGGRVVLLDGVEVLSRHHFRTKDEARQVISAWVEEFYNPTRRHGSAGMTSPIHFEKSLTIRSVTA